MPRRRPSVPPALERLASFPLLNPNPIVEVDATGKVAFCNDAAVQAAARLGAKDASAFLPPSLPDVLAALKRGEHTSTQCEVRVGAATFAVTALTAPGSNAVHVYAADVTERSRTEAALREGEEKYRNLVERASEGIVVIQDGVCRFANRRANDMWGTGRGPVVGSPFTRFIHPDSLSRVRERYGRRMAGQDVPDTYEVQLLRADGSSFPAELNAGVVTINGRAADMVVIRDITERRRAEQALRESEERFRTIAQTAPDAIVMLDDEGRIEFWNQAAERIFGYARAEALGLYLPDLVAPRALRERFRTGLGEFGRDGKGPLLGRLACFAAIRRDGSEFPVELTVSAMRLKERWHSIGMIRDVTERKQAEERERERTREQSLLSAAAMAFVQMRPTDDLHQFICDKLCELAGEAYVVVNSHEPKTGRFTVRAVSGLNQGMETVVKLMGREPVGTEFALTPEQVHRYRKDVLQKFEHGLAGLSDGRLPKAVCRTLEATFGLGDVYAGALYWGGELLGTVNILMRKGHALREPIVVGTFVHQSAVALARVQAEQELARHRLHLEELVAERTAELKQAQERLLLQEKLAMLGRVAGSVAHQLRNPLGAIRNASYFLQQTVADKLEGKPLRHLQAIDEYVEHANRAITMLLDFTWQQQTEPRRCALQPILDRALAEAAMPVNVSVCCALPEHLPHLLVDERRMVAVFHNLLTNAAQAMPAGGTVRIAAEVTGAAISIAVSDTGSGIQPEHVHRLFEPFFTTKSVGVGLGLPLCKEFVEANKGTIAVASELGKGTTFTVTLPRAEVEPGIRTAVEPKTAVPARLPVEYPTSGTC